MPLLSTSESEIEYVVVGSGSPVTVFAHGLAGSIPETRPFGSGVAGTRTFLHFRGHGASSGPETPWTYSALADELRAVADHVGATQALGVSLGSGALLRIVAADPGRFQRFVLVLPATIDAPRVDPAVRRMLAMADHLEHRDLAAAAAQLVDEQPVAARDRADVHVWADKQAHRLAGTSVSRALRELPGAAPLDDRAALAQVKCPVLIVAQQGDDAHPTHIAEQLAAVFPSAHLTVFDAGGVLWTHRRELRELIGGFLAAQRDPG